MCRLQTAIATSHLVRTSLLILCVLVCCPEAISQCTTGHLTINGRIENYRERSTQAEVTVLLKKGKTVKSLAITRPSFSFDVPFSTLSSYSFLWGHRCNNSPVSVIVKIKSGEAKLGERKLAIKNDFRIDGPLAYTLRNELVFRISDQVTQN